MIKFFRKIRQQLIQDNKMGKYFKYAIGEIILVVIGILIALQLNSMRERSIDRQKEQSYLKEINLDFKSNKIQLDSIIEHNKKALHACKRLQFHIKNLRGYKNAKDIENHPLSDSLMYYQGWAFANKSYNPKSGSVRALINSSSFDLIQNDSLRRLLISWEDVLGDYLEEEEFARKFLFDYYYPYQTRTYEFETYFSEKNVKAWFGTMGYNNRAARIEGLESILYAIETEGILTMINDIIKLTEPNN